MVARRLSSDLVAGPADLRWCGQQQDGEVRARSGRRANAEVVEWIRVARTACWLLLLAGSGWVDDGVEVHLGPHW